MWDIRYLGDPFVCRERPCQTRSNSCEKYQKWDVVTIGIIRQRLDFPSLRISRVIYTNCIKAGIQLRLPNSRDIIRALFFHAERRMNPHWLRLLSTIRLADCMDDHNSCSPTGHNQHGAIYPCQLPLPPPTKNFSLSHSPCPTCYKQ